MSFVYRDEAELPRPPPCQGCPATEKWVAQFGLACACYACARLHEPRRAGEKADRKPDALDELDNLARWTPDIVGKAITLEPPLLPADEHSSGTLGRMRPDEVPEDDEVVGGIDGLTLHVSGRRHGTASPGRPDHVDDASEQFGRAVRTLRRLDHLAASPDGFRHVIVLLYAGWFHGQESRAYWDRVDDDALVYGEEDSARYHLETGAERGAPLGFVWRLGWFCAPEPARVSWLAQEYLTLAWAAARSLGREVLAAALGAFALVPLEPERGSVPRLDLVKVSTTISVVEDAVDRELLGELRSRIHVRRCRVKARKS